MGREVRFWESHDLCTVVEMLVEMNFEDFNLCNSSSFLATKYATNIKTFEAKLT